jgi:hypothetical protein
MGEFDNGVRVVCALIWLLTWGIASTYKVRFKGDGLLFFMTAVSMALGAWLYDAFK